MKACPVPSPGFRKVEAAVGYAPAASFWTQNEGGTDEPYKFWGGKPSQIFSKVSAKYGELAGIKARIIAETEWMKKWKQKQVPVRDGVAFLFSTNLELANAVYEALGFKYLKNFDGNVNLLASDIASSYDGSKNPSDFIPEIQKDLEKAQQLYSHYLGTVFPDSKVRDIVYHGTNNTFKVFEESKVTEGRNSQGKGIYFTTKERARDWANQYEDPNWSPEFKGDVPPLYGKIVAALINIQNPQLDAYYQDAIPLEFDGIISEDFAVKSVKQVLLLGSKQDIASFKEFLNVEQSGEPHVVGTNQLNFYNGSEYLSVLEPYVGKIEGEFDSAVVTNRNHPAAQLDMFAPVMAEPAPAPVKDNAEGNQLLNAVRGFLNAAGVSVNTVERIVNRHGEPVQNATGRASIQKVGDAVKKTIDLVMGKAGMDVVNEETAHIFVGMLPEDSPLYRSMYNKIVEYGIYDTIKANPEAFGVTDEKSIREEAMGRVIADHISNPSPSSEALKPWTVSWFQRAIAFVKRNLLGIMDTNPFAKSAYQILTGDTSGLGPGRETELFNIEPVQTTIANKIIADNRRFVIKEIDNAELAKKQGKIPLSFKATTSRYFDTLTGKVVTSRVTDRSTLEWRRGMGLRLEEYEKDPNNQVAAEVGTALHDFAMRMGEFLVYGGTKPTPNSIVTPEAAMQIEARMVSLIEEVREQQNDIDPNGTPVFLFEHTIFDPAKDMGGSMDMVVIFSDGSASIYDHKFMTGIQTIGYGQNMRFSQDAQISELKIRGYDQQLATYKKILKQYYGVKNFRKTRILPGAVKLKEGYTGKSSPDKKYNDINWVREPKIVLFSYGESKLTDEIPVAGETTGDQKIDKLLTSFMTLRDNLINQRKQTQFGSAQYERFSVRIEQITNAIRGMQRDKSVTSLITDAWGLIKTIDTVLGIEDKNHKDYMSDTEVIDAYESIELYIHSMGVIQEMMKDYKSKDPSLYAKQKEQLKTILEKAILVRSALTEVIADRVEISTGVDITAPAEELGWWGRTMGSLFQMSQPVFRAFSTIIKKSINATKRKVFDVAKEIEAAQKELIEWGKVNGKTGISIYDPLYNKETGNLYGEFSKDFYTLRAKARQENNWKWFTDNYVQTAEDRARFLQEKKKRFDIIDKRYKDEVDADGNIVSQESKRESLKKYWLSQNDLSLLPNGMPVYPDAWVNEKYIYATVKDRAKWASEEYKYIQSVPALKKFYDLHIRLNEEFREFLPERIPRNFVANIRKDAIDVIASEGIGAIAGLGNSFIESFQVMEEDKDFGMTDPFTGNVTPAIPTMFTKPIFNSDGKVDLTNKSQDLARNLLMFANMAYNYKHMSEIEHMGLMMRHYIQSKDYQEMVTDAFGNVKYDSNTGNLKVKQGSPATVEAFNNWLNYYVYGQKSQGSDVQIEVQGKKYSGKKVLKGMMRYLSAKALSLNFISATANVAAASSAGYMEGVKNTHYNTEQYRRGFKKAVARDPKVIAAFEFLQVPQEEFVYLKSNELSASKVAKTFTFDKLFILHRKGDDLIDFAITSAILEAKGFDEEGNLVDADGTKVKSIYESMKLEGDKWKNMYDLPQDQYITLRNYIRYVASTVKGNMSSENVAATKGQLLYQVAMQFRSWLPRLAEERFSKLRYNEDINAYELGRYRAFWNQFTGETFLPALKQFTKNLTALKLSSIKANPAVLEVMLAEYREKNPSLDITMEEFTKLVESQTRALAMELRIIFATILPLIIAGGLFSDDDEEDPLFVKQLVKAINRTNSELTFFLSPKSTTEILSSPFPVMSVLTDLTRLVRNTGDEAIDDVFGEDTNRDKTPRFYYVGKMIPSVYGVLRTLDIFEQQR